jgi:hypothetical protein
MGAIPKSNSGVTYYSIKAGAIVKPANEGDEGAIKRTYTNPSTGKTGVVYEYQYSGLVGFIYDIQFKDFEYEDRTFSVLELSIMDKDFDKMKLSIPYPSDFASDFLLKYPNIDYSKEVKLSPYIKKSTNPTKPRDIKRMYITQVIDGKETPINFYFKEYVEEKKRFKNIHGLPNPENPQDMDTDDWTYYYAKCNKWLKNHLLTNWKPLINIDDMKETEKIEDKVEAKAESFIPKTSNKATKKIREALYEDDDVSLLNDDLPF